MLSAKLQHRANARPFFARERISDFQILDKHAAITTKLLSRISASGLPCDAQDLYARFTLDSASEFLFGNNLATLSGKLPEAGKTQMGPKGSATDDAFGSFAQAFEEAQCVITQRARMGYFWPAVEFGRNRLHEAATVTKRFLDPIVTRALEEKAKVRRLGVESAIADRTFLEHLAASTEGLSEAMRVVCASEPLTS